MFLHHIISISASIILITIYPNRALFFVCCQTGEIRYLYSIEREIALLPHYQYTPFSFLSVYCVANHPRFVSVISSRSFFLLYHYIFLSSSPYSTPFLHLWKERDHEWAAPVFALTFFLG